MLNIDTELENADWLRYGGEFAFQTPDELAEYLRLTGLSWEKFKTLPIYRNNVERVPWLRDFEMPDSSPPAVDE